MDVGATCPVPDESRIAQTRVVQAPPHEASNGFTNSVTRTRLVPEAEEKYGESLKTVCAFAMTRPCIESSKAAERRTTTLGVHVGGKSTGVCIQMSRHMSYV